MEIDRERIEMVRRLLVDAFMAEDTPTFGQCVTELETLIGVPHGDRNPKANGAHAMHGARSTQQRKAASRKAVHARWGGRSLDAEMHDDGLVTYTIKFGPDGDG